MAEVSIRREIFISADTIGDVMKWLNYVDGQPMSTPLTEPVTLAIQIDEQATPPMRPRDRDEEGRR
jgi:hypothetical protein